MVFRRWDFKKKSRHEKEHETQGWGGPPLCKEESVWTEKGHSSVEIKNYQFGVLRKHLGTILKQKGLAVKTVWILASVIIQLFQNSKKQSLQVEFSTPTLALWSQKAWMVITQARWPPLPRDGISTACDQSAPSHWGMTPPLREETEGKQSCVSNLTVPNQTEMLVICFQ